MLPLLLRWYKTPWSVGWASEESWFDGFPRLVVIWSTSILFVILNSISLFSNLSLREILQDNKKISNIERIQEHLHQRDELRTRIQHYCGWRDLLMQRKVQILQVGWQVNRRQITQITSGDSSPRRGTESVRNTALGSIRRWAVTQSTNFWDPGLLLEACWRANHYHKRIQSEPYSKRSLTVIQFAVGWDTTALIPSSKFLGIFEISLSLSSKLVSSCADVLRVSKTSLSCIESS